MKLFLCAVVALASLSAFAQKSMVTLSGYETGTSTDRSLDLASGSGSNPHVYATNIALNYAYSVTDAVQVGAKYKNFREETSGSASAQSSKTLGLQVIYNFAGKLTDTDYAAVHYDTKTMTQSNDKTNTWTAEYGHRFSLGNLWGMNFNYSPSASLAFAKTSPAASGSDDSSTTSFTLNFVKFDVLF